MLRRPQRREELFSETLRIQVSHEGLAQEVEGRGIVERRLESTEIVRNAGAASRAQSMAALSMRYPGSGSGFGLAAACRSRRFQARSPRRAGRSRGVPVGEAGAHHVERHAQGVVTRHRLETCGGNRFVAKRRPFRNKPCRPWRRRRQREALFGQAGPVRAGREPAMTGNSLEHPIREIDDGTVRPIRAIRSPHAGQSSSLPPSRRTAFSPSAVAILRPATR